MGDKKDPKCAVCGIHILEKACFFDSGKGPDTCPTLGFEDLIEEARKEYEKPQIKEFARLASLQEAECYLDRDRQPFVLHCSKTRIQEICEFAQKIGAGHRSLYPATTTQGELQFLYAHGVISSGEHKSSLRHSSFPVQRAWVNFIGPPQVDPLLLRDIEQADLIILAPGSLYSSIIPIFQVPALTDAVRSNTHALKILGANFWAQHGETDISSHRQGKEYYVSELIEAYHNNIPGGIQGLVHQVVVTDLQAIPGDILRNYALEGKVPIYLDKKRVAEWGLEPIEAAVFSEERLRSDKVIQHDPEKFAQVIRTLCVLRNYLCDPSPPPYPPPIDIRPTAPLRPQKGYLSEYADKAERRIAAMDIRHPGLRDLLKDVIWDNREILFEHLLYFQGILVIPARSWARSTEWDNILGYFDPDDGYIKLHARLLNAPEIRRVEDILIAMGESLLGNYVLWKRVRPLSEETESVGKVFEIHLQKPHRRRSFLNDAEIREYLHLAQLCPSTENQALLRMVINDNEAFTPPGLLFGLLYAWYLNNSLGGVVEYEMSLMRWKISQLIPKQSMERARKQRLIEFFRTRVFRQQIP